jgi:multidrug efflux pump subunit AcrA (membrane-fusion protein)
MPQQASGSEAKAGRSRSIGFTQIILILAVIAVALYFARAPDRVQRDVPPDPATEAGKPAVGVIEPVPTAHAMTVELTGTVRLEERTSVSSEVVGRVVWVSPEFSNGGSISANEPVVRIDPREYEIRVQAAERAVEAAEARLWMERARAEEDLESFLRDNPDAADLKRRVAVVDCLLRATTDAEATTADGERQLTTDECFQLDNPDTDPPYSTLRLASIALAEAELGKERSKLELARLLLERTSVSIPYDVRVVSSEVDVGEVVGPAEHVGAASLLGVVYRPSALEVDAPIEANVLEDLAPAIGRSARVRTRWAEYDAEVARVSSVVNPRSRLASVFLDFSGSHPADSLPLPGTFVEVAIEGPVHENVYLLPESVVQEGRRVWVVDGGALRSHEPRMLGHSGDGWMVEAFDTGEGVVIGSLPEAADGLEVVVTQSGNSG